jgi:DHA2 family multidrug resistance protein-like MFS transporter
MLVARLVPPQQGRPEQPLNIPHALMLIVAILLLVYSAKTALKGAVSPWWVASTLSVGTTLLFIFVRIQLRASTPMIDMRLFCHRIILSGVVMAMTAMIALVGFELLMALKCCCPNNKETTKTPMELPSCIEPRRNFPRQRPSAMSWNLLPAR